MIVTLDFETEAIDKSSIVPPKPVGYAFKINDDQSKYRSWGHPGQNNWSLELAYEELSDLCALSSTIVMHNAKFDLAVLKHYFSMSPGRRFDDTMLLAFIHSPNSKTLSLKPLSDKLLNMPPDEQDDLKEWVITNIKGATSPAALATANIIPVIMAGLDIGIMTLIMVSNLVAPRA